MEIDHIGFVVQDVESAVKRFVDIFGFALEGEIIFDPEQHVRLAMLTSSNNYRVELIQPIDDTSPSYHFMTKGGGLHHLCYAVKDLDKAIKELKSQGHLLFKRPVEAPLFQGKRVAFFFSKVDKQIIEIVETIKNG